MHKGAFRVAIEFIACCRDFYCLNWIRSTCKGMFRVVVAAISNRPNHTRAPDPRPARLLTLKRYFDKITKSYRYVKT